ncbi:MAG: hypothetical protein MMC33_000722 [Icmadophila ericetorum]|nr:hypothetical protein [Icmadophila ericetorum]
MPASTRSASVSTERPSSSIAFSSQKPPHVPTSHRQAPELSLQASRRGITSALHSLAAIKSQEAELYYSRISAEESQLREAQALERKKQGIEDAIHNISQDPEHGRSALATMEAEETAIIAEIRNLEDRLMELRARERRIHQTREQMSSRLGAKLSSWQNALKDVDKKIEQTLLSFYDEQRSLGNRRSPNAPQDCTLSALEEHLRSQNATLQTAQSAAAHESSACTHGAQTWTSVIHTVNTLESALRHALHQNKSSKTLLLDPSGQEDTTASQQELLGQFDDAILTLEDALMESEEQGWALLMVAIAAELEALREGREMLRGVMGENDNSAHFVIERGNGDKTLERTPKSAGEPLVEISSSPAGLELPGVRAEDDEDEDDGPGPELLISHLGDE